MEIKFIDIKDVKNRFKNGNHFGLILFLENGIILSNNIKYEINQNDLVLIKPQNDFCFPSENQKMVLMDIENYYVYFEDKDIYPLTVYQKNHQNNILWHKIVQEFMIKTKYFEDAIGCYLEMMLINLLRQIGNKYEKEINLLESIKIYIDNNLKENIYLEDIKKFLNIETGSLNYYFKKYFNKTPMKFIDEYRLSKAKEIINLTKSVKKTQEALGFKSLSSFSRWFKNIDGKSPMYYKDNINNN